MTAPVDPPWRSPLDRQSAAGVLVTMLAAATLLRLQGRTWWCACGGWSPWAAINTAHTSQHLLDAYSFTHIQHGLVGWWIAHGLFSRWLSARARLVTVVVFEASWELLENSSFIIEKYRADTVSLDYFGDSIVNSISDISCCLLGFVLASRLGWRRSLALFVAVEALMLLVVRDSLLLNVIMLIHPVAAIKRWQQSS